MPDENLYSISLFSASGIGDVGLKAAGYDFILMCEIEHDRSELLKLNYPATQIVADDINKSVNCIEASAKEFLRQSHGHMFLIECTAPCQGMSKSGQGKLLKGVREGKRPKLDPRNRLILPALKIICDLRPLFVVFENVYEMRNTVIKDDAGKLRPILEIIETSLGGEYVGTAYDVEFADYGIPQRRKRLITVYTRDKNAVVFYRKGIPLIPETTHSRDGKRGKIPWIPIEEALKGFPSLDSKSEETASNSKIPFHSVPVLEPIKYEWIKNTPVNGSAFDNQCINPKCNFNGNKMHGNSKNGDGVNQSRKDTPLYCEKCGSLLPRPYVKNQNGSLRIMSGYTSAYKRMDPKLPAPALTRNMSFPCSDHKVHPYENRVLSLAEAMKAHSLSEYDYLWGPIKDKKGRTKKCAPDTLIRESIGESIPPRFMELLGRHLIELSKRESEFKVKNLQGVLF